MDDEILRQVTAFTDNAHGSQKRKYSPDRYIVHPVRVMELCRAHTTDITVLSAALLHDVLEDTAVSKSAITHFLSDLMDAPKAKRTLLLVEELTDQYVKSAYPSFNRRRRKALELERMSTISADAQTIKYADIIDNCKEIVLKDPDFAKVFLNECLKLLKELKDGNKELYKMACDEVARGLSLLDKKHMA